MHAWTEGKSLREIIADANISSGFNAAVHGIWPHITDKDRAFAKELEKKVLEKTVRIL